MLHKLQTDFSAAVFQRPVPATLRDALDPEHCLDPEAQIAVYRGSVLGGMVKALAEVYPVCKRLVGDEFFDAMATRFVRATPSTSPDLNAFGESMPSFVADFPPAGTLPYLPDVMRLEWAWHHAFHTADSGPIDLKRLAAVPETHRGGIVFEPARGSTLLESPYPVMRIWEVNQDDYAGDEHVNLAEGGVRLIIWRRHDELRIDPLLDEQWHILRAISHRQPFNDLCIEMNEHFPECDIGALLGAVIQHGWLSDFEVAPAGRS